MASSSSPASISSPTTTTNRRLIQVAIVFGVFPTLAWLITITTGLVLTLPFLWVDSLPNVLKMIIVIVPQVVGIVGAGLISWHFWPKRQT